MTHPLIAAWSDRVNSALSEPAYEIRTSYSPRAAAEWRWLAWFPDDDEGPIAFAEHEHLAIADLKRQMEERS